MTEKTEKIIAHELRAAMPTAPEGYHYEIEDIKIDPFNSGGENMVFALKWKLVENY